MKSRLQTEYESKIIPNLMEKYNFSNVYAVPKLTKIVLSMGLGTSKGKERNIKKSTQELTMLAGQKAIITKAKKSVSQFKVRQGMETGAMVTLRGDKMYHFLDRLINIALLNDKNFGGIKNRSINLQKYTTLSMGIEDHKIFPEIVSDSVDKSGFNISICSNSMDKDVFKDLLKMFGLPFIGEKYHGI